MLNNEQEIKPIQIAEVFKPLFEDNGILDFIMEAGRDSGKSKTAYILAGLQSAEHPNEDIVITRASYGSIGDSCYNEVVEVIESIPQFEGMFDYRKSPLRVVRKGGGTNIYFMGVGGSKERTKGIKPIHNVGLVIIEEAQELKSKEHLDQTLASLRRRFGETCKVVIIFNPPAQELHWINVWAKQKRHDSDYMVMHPTWLDILPFLKDRDVKEILKTKYENEVYYNYMYMGIPSGSEGAVYPMFNSNKHIITPQQYEWLISNTAIRPVLCIIGGDGSVVRDATSFVAKILLSNNCVVIAPIFYHNPKENGVLSSNQLVTTQVVRWFNDTIRMFHLGSLEEIQEANRRGMHITTVPIFMRIDSAATDLIRECQFMFSNRADVGAIRKGTILQMVEVYQNALANDNEYIIDYGGYYNYTSNKWIQRSPNLLAEQLSMLIWDDTQTKYDPIVPNDVCDASTYATYFWYKNIENINYFNIIKANNVSSMKICDILKNIQGES